MATIRDVAKAAKVSVTTASRVVNKEPTVRSYLRERVEAAILELNYRPNLAARRLSSMRSFTIGMIVPRAGIGYIPRLIVELSWLCRAEGHLLVPEAVEFEDRLTAFSHLDGDALRPDAIILAPRFSDDDRLLARFEAEEIPLVRLGGSPDRYGLSIQIDDREMAAEMVRHLIALGHRRIGMIGLPLAGSGARARREGYEQALREAGLPCDGQLFVEGSYSYRSGVEGLNRLLALSCPPTAIFAANDTMAAGAQAQALKLGLLVPQDVAIAGFEDSPILRATFPAITSVSFPVAQIAEIAAHAAIHGSLSPFTLDPSLILRGSTTGDQDLCEDPYLP
ncbi:LacI family DNA-binding transcriptional regulator [uncultured Novosphingobium sp.]|uniref:LacI family DNA-binding transcriptional regulator n=1 Tax=uncultured Novosphingobium sp. TaxID=292277 RepID=UPI0025912E54|nr:LacI family DNA-binding transcriptional regulator [uncultured Novosphingobium sp.]